MELLKKKYCGMEVNWDFPDELLGDIEETTVLDLIDSGGIRMTRENYFGRTKYKEDYYDTY